MPNYLYILFAVAILSAAIIVKSIQSRTFARKELLEISRSVWKFLAQCESMKGRYIPKTEEASLREQWNSTFCRVLALKPPRSKEIRASLEKFKRAYSQIESFVAEENEKYISLIHEIHRPFFADIDGKSLDKAQREAVIAEEELALIIAGAGSGKTLTIAAKVKYLCEIKRENPKDILLISFTQKAAKEMSERIGRLGVPIESMTFHKFGKDILFEAEGKSPEVFNDLEKFLQDFFNKKIDKYENLARDLIEYFAYYVNIPKDLNCCKSLGELYDAERDADLKSLKAKYDENRYLRQKFDENSNKSWYQLVNATMPNLCKRYSFGVM